MGSGDPARQPLRRTAINSQLARPPVIKILPAGVRKIMAINSVRLWSPEGLLTKWCCVRSALILEVSLLSFPLAINPRLHLRICTR